MQQHNEYQHVQKSSSKQIFRPSDSKKLIINHNLNQLKSLSPLKKSNPYYTNMINNNQIDQKNNKIENNIKTSLDMQKIIKIKNNKIFEDYQLFKDNQLGGYKNNKYKQQQEKSLQKYKETVINNILTQIQLIFCQKPTILQTSLNQIYLILQGKAFQYVHNQNPIIKSKIHENNDYVMVRKLAQNDYFMTEIQKQIKNQTFYHRKQINSSRGNKDKNEIKKDFMQKIDKDSKKYQLMVDQHTILVKISNQNYRNYFKPLIMQKINNLTKFMKNVSLFENLTNNVFLQLSRFIGVRFFKRGEQIIKVSDKIKSKQIFFVRQGQVRFSVYENKGECEQSTKQLRLIQQLTLQEYDVFGMDTLHTIKTKAPLTLSDYSAIALSPHLQLYSIDKRILAIVISSFQSQLKLSLSHSQNYIKQININSQIKGQNYMSQREQYLLRNVNRIKTSQKKVRDDRLRRSYSKNMKREVNTVIPEKDRICYVEGEQKYQRNCQNYQRNSNNLILARSQTSFKLKSVSLIKSNFKQTARKSLVESLAWELYEADGSKRNSFKNLTRADEKIVEKTKISSFAITALEEDPPTSSLVIKKN